MDRRTRSLGYIAAGVALLVVAGAVHAVVDNRADVVATRPNILIIVTDDQRESMGVLPHVRQFFGEGGTRFSRGFANTPLCCPARATLMSGQYSHNHGVTGNKSWEQLNPQHTLQHDLRADGYRTAIFGKYLNRFPVAQRKPPGFDRFAVFQSGGSGTEYYQGGTWNINGTVRTVNTYSTDFIETKGERFIRADDDRPWMMILSLPAPHRPSTAERRYEKARIGSWEGNPAVFEKDRSDKPPWVRRFDVTFRKGRAIRRAQQRTLMSVNDLVASIRTALRTTGQARNTLAFFTTDNSYLWGEHRMGGKPSPYMQSIRVPFYVRWPGHFSAGGVKRHLVSHVDITATAYDAAGVVPLHDLDGYSLLGSHRRRRLLTEMLRGVKGIPHWSSLLTASGDHYIEYGPADDVLFRELYELDEDPWELRNIASKRPGRRAQLSALLSADRHCAGTACP
jgi:arylsulfatase A-like enzyme